MNQEDDIHEGTLFPRTRRMQPAPVEPEKANGGGEGSAGAAPDAKLYEALKSNGLTDSQTEENNEVDMSIWNAKGFVWAPDPEADFMANRGTNAKVKKVAIVRVVKTNTEIFNAYNDARKRLHVPKSCAFISPWSGVMPSCFVVPLLWCIPATLRKCGCIPFQPMSCDKNILILTEKGVCGYDIYGNVAAIEWGGVHPDEGIHHKVSTVDPPIPSCGYSCCGTTKSSTDVPELTCGIGLGLGLPCSSMNCYHEHVADYCEVVVTSKMRDASGTAPLMSIIIKAAKSGKNKESMEGIVKEMRQMASDNQLKQVVYSYH